jgi:hypothetical protein
MFTQLAGFLSGTQTIGGTEMQSMADELMAASAAHARVIDKAIRQAFGPRLTEDPNYDVETAPDYHVPEAIAAMNPEAATTLLVETDRTSRGPRGSARNPRRVFRGCRRDRRSADARAAAGGGGFDAMSLPLHDALTAFHATYAGGAPGVRPPGPARWDLELRMAGGAARSATPPDDRRSRVRRRIPARGRGASSKGVTPDSSGST